MITDENDFYRDQSQSSYATGNGKRFVEKGLVEKYKQLSETYSPGFYSLSKTLIVDHVKEIADNGVKYIHMSFIPPETTFYNEIIADLKSQVPTSDVFYANINEPHEYSKIVLKTIGESLVSYHPQLYMLDIPKEFANHAIRVTFTKVKKTYKKLLPLEPPIIEFTRANYKIVKRGDRFALVLKLNPEMAKTLNRRSEDEKIFIRFHRD